MRNTEAMSERSSFSADKAREIGERIGIDWAALAVRRRAVPDRASRSSSSTDVEIHETNVTDDDELTTGKIARAHLNEFPDYYTRLAKMEAEAEPVLVRARDLTRRQPPRRVLSSRSPAPESGQHFGPARVAISMPRRPSRRYGGDLPARVRIVSLQSSPFLRCR